MAAGVSPGTVSHVFNHPERVRAELRARVLATARQLGYAGPSPAGRALRAGRVGSVGVVTSNDLAYFFEDPFARVFMRGVAAVCERRGAGLSLISTRHRQRAAWTIDSALVDGFIALCTETGDTLAQRTRRRGLPYVTVDHEAPPGGAVVIDNEHGAWLAARHLLDLGHRHLGILGFAQPRTGRAVRYCDAGPDRLAGYRRAMAEVASTDQTWQTADTGADPRAIEAVLRQWCSVSSAPVERVTGVLAMSDLIARQAIAAADRRGLRVPADLSVVGFDDIPEAAAAPTLTTVHQPIEDKGRHAASMLLSGQLSIRRLPLTLMIRNSSSIPPGSR